MLRSPNCIVQSIFSSRFYHKISKVLQENLKPDHVRKNEPIISEKNCNSYLGQPSPFTHPHKLSPEQVTEGLSKDEFTERRLKLMFDVKKSAEAMGARPSNRNLIIMPASTTVFSGPDVPYPFRQESNFLYLTGYQEPDIYKQDKSVENRFYGLTLNRSKFNEKFDLKFKKIEQQPLIADSISPMFHIR
uniref:Aminopeptidase P N-terminal domain-containing protein n=1 Tax=Romanomermis culicivorax TaxID=13658 RepID=A0A915HI19_ROMCU